MRFGHSLVVTSIVHVWPGRACECRRMPLMNDIFMNVESGTTTSYYAYSIAQELNYGLAVSNFQNHYANAYEELPRPSQTLLCFCITRSHSYNERTATKTTGTRREVHAIIVQQTALAVQMSLCSRTWGMRDGYGERAERVRGFRRISIFKLLFGCI